MESLKAIGWWLAPYLSIGGRLSRTQFMIGMVLAAMLQSMLASLLHGAATNWRQELYVDWLAQGLCLPLFMLLVAKRLRDFDFSPWWALLALPAGASSIFRKWEVSLLNPWVLTDKGPFNDPVLAAMGWSDLIGLVGLCLAILSLYVLLVPSTAGPNRYGPDPHRLREDEANMSDTSAG